MRIDRGARSQTKTSTAQALQWAPTGLGFISYANRTLVSKAPGPTIATYAAPLPQPGTGSHMCIFFLYGQQPLRHFPMAFVASGAENRTKFGLGDFAEQLGTGQPLAANHFVSQSLSTMIGNGTVTGVGGSIAKRIAWAPLDWRGYGVGTKVELWWSCQRFS